jgi:hypothetical protein
MLTNAQTCAQDPSPTTHKHEHTHTHTNTNTNHLLHFSRLAIRSTKAQHAHALAHTEARICTHRVAGHFSVATRHGEGAVAVLRDAEARERHVGHALALLLGIELVPEVALVVRPCARAVGSAAAAAAVRMCGHARAISIR